LPDLRQDEKYAHKVAAAVAGVKGISDLGVFDTMGVAAALFALATAAPAEEASVLPCRPTIACTAHIEAAGLLTLEAGYLLRKLDKGVTQRSMPFLFKLSFNDWLQGQLGSNGPTFADGNPGPGTRSSSAISRRTCRSA
jgi:hypothetical protein